MRPSRISSSSLSFGSSFSSRKDPLKLELRMLLPAAVELMDRLELGRIIISTSSEIDSSGINVASASSFDAR